MTNQYKTATSQVVVIGTSAGGVSALKALFSKLEKDFPVPILVVQHMAPDATGNMLLNALNKNSNLKCKHAVSGDKLTPGHVHLAPPDHHLLISQEQKILVTKGAHENRYRPAIDPLFRSAAVAFGNKVIGILLTGLLDDGTAGMRAIKKCGGVCIVQDPADAEYPDMPQNALNQVKVDFSVPISEMDKLLYQIIYRKSKNTNGIPKDILTEAKIAERVLSDLHSEIVPGEQVPFACPSCGGVLSRIGEESPFRCHTGHAYTSNSLLAAQTQKIEETMWTALRMFEERKNLLITMAKEKSGSSAESALERAELSQIHIDRIRQILMADDKDLFLPKAEVQSDNG